MSQQQNKTAVVRDAHGRIISGTPNPGGRSKANRTVIELARKRTTKAIQTLTHIMLTSKDDSARVKAASVLLDRGWGKAPQQIDVRHKVSPRNMSAQEIEARLEELKGGEHAH